MTASCDDPGRRLWLKLAALAMLPTPLLSACGDGSGSSAPASATPFSADFAVPGMGRVRLDFQDEQTFSLTPDMGPGSTMAIAGDIYLHVAPSIATADTARLLLLGRLAPAASGGAADRIRLVPAVPSTEQLEAWGADRRIFTATGPSAPGLAAGALWVAQEPALARAQYAVGTRLRDGMDMRLCGDVVARLIGTWPTEVALAGLAILGHSSGVRMVAQPGPLRGAVALPTGLEIEDYRLRAG